MTSKEVWELLESYGADGVYSRSWASSYARFDRLVRLLVLQAEKRKRDGVAREASSDEARLFMLLFERWFRALHADAERQCQVCLVLGISPPPDVDPGRVVDAAWAAQREAVIVGAREHAVELHPPARTRPWYWGHEARAGNAYLGFDADRPVVYAHDWNPETHPDLYGFGHRWTPGEVLVIPAEELPHVAEIVRPKPAARYEAEPRGELEDGVEVAEVVEDPADATPARDPEPRRSGGFVLSGGWRELGTIDRESGGFVPGPGFWR